MNQAQLDQFNQLNFIISDNKNIPILTEYLKIHKIDEYVFDAIFDDNVIYENLPLIKKILYVETRKQFDEEIAKVQAKAQSQVQVQVQVQEENLYKKQEKAFNKYLQDEKNLDGMNINLLNLFDFEIYKLSFVNMSINLLVRQKLYSAFKLFLS